MFVSLEKKDVILFGDGDELFSNYLNNLYMNDLIVGFGCCQVLVGGVVFGVFVFFGVVFFVSVVFVEVQVFVVEGLCGLFFKCCNCLFFEVIVSGCVDIIWVFVGYKVMFFIFWGILISGSYLGFFDDVSNSVQDQVEQIGMYYDGMYFFLIDVQFGFGGGYISNYGLLVFNYEYIDVLLLYINGLIVVDGKCIVVDEVCKEINVYGVFVVEICCNVCGEWNVVLL